MRLLKSGRRAGLSLTEVLITIYIVGIGLIAILTLFPYGAMQMAQSVQDDRSAYCAANADTGAKLFWQQIWLRPDGRLRPLVNNTTVWPPVSDPLNPHDEALEMDQALMSALEDPLPGVAFPTQGPRFSSYPVLIDPYGRLTFGAQGSVRGANWVAGQPPGTNPIVTDYAAALDARIPRRTVTVVDIVPDATAIPPVTDLKPGLQLTSVSSIRRNCTFLDDLNFLEGEGGATVSLTSTEPQRAGKYTWAWLVQRFAGSSTNDVHLTVVVYSGRSLDTPTAEHMFDAQFTPGTTEMLIDTGGAEPPVKVGGWVLDATRELDPRNFMLLHQHGVFYRVLAIQQDEINPSLYRLELESRILPDRIPDSLSNPHSRKVIIMEGVVEVFDRDRIIPFAKPRSDRLTYDK